MKYAKKLDAHHTETKNLLMRYGWHVCDMSATGKYPDLLCWKKDSVAWLELKVPGSAAKWTRTQLEYIAETPMPVATAVSPEQAYERLRDGSYITQRAKDAIAGVLLRSDKEYFTPTEIANAVVSR
jgi:hypothetical protein